MLLVNPDVSSKGGSWLRIWLRIRGQEGQPSRAVGAFAHGSTRARQEAFTSPRGRCSVGSPNGRPCTTLIGVSYQYSTHLELSVQYLLESIIRQSE